MAKTIRLIRLTWENNDEFKMETKLNDGDYLTIIEMAENGEISALWEHAGKLCKKYLNLLIDDIGTVMKG